MVPTPPAPPCWLPRPPCGGDDVLYCLPRAGSGPRQFASWPGTLAGRAVHPLCFPGDRDAAWWTEHPGFPEQAADLVDGLAGHLAGRYSLFAPGSSALLAVAAVHEAARRGLRLPDRLVVSGGPPPPGPRPPDPGDEARTDRALLTLLELGRNPMPFLVEAAVRALRAEHRALCDERPSPPHRPDVPVTVVAWSGDPDAGPDALAGWLDHPDAELHTLPGGPHTYATAPGPLLAVLAHHVLHDTLREPGPVG